MKTLKKAISLVFLFSVLLTLSACCLKHEWQEATCMEPKTCIKCGTTEGEALGHEWIAASCAEPQTCERCGVTEGEPLGHTWNEWEVTQEATPTTQGVRTRACAICGETDEEKFDLEKLFENDVFLLSPAEIGARLSEKLIAQKATMHYDLNGMTCGITGVGKIGSYDTGYEDGEAIGAVIFATERGVMGISQKDDRTVNTVTTRFFTTDTDKIVDAMLGILETFDGSLDDDSARTVGKEIVKAYGNGDISYKYNGITYSFTQMKDYYVFFVTLGQS